jgi:hypothetical protein
MKTELALIGLAAIFAMPAKADETLKYRAVYHVLAAQSHDVGDVDGHTITLTHTSGLASFPDGSVATENIVGTVDYTKGSGQFVLYVVLTLNDGSVLWYKQNGMGTIQGTKSNLRGTITVVGGKGRFEGAKGDGSATGERLQTLAAGALIYSDITLNVKK